MLYYAHYNISATNIQRQWGAASSKQNAEDPVQTVEVYGSDQKYRACGSITPITPSKIEELRQMLGQTNGLLLAS